ncbi:MAG: hypothetical protein LUQ32_05625 [Methanomicrobiales archaeon]|nr:hypothetical protein [Methanomicrobiales archaeon]
MVDSILPSLSGRGIGRIGIKGWVITVSRPISPVSRVNPGAGEEDMGETGPLFILDEIAVWAPAPEETKRRGENPPRESLLKSGLFCSFTPE